MKLKNASLSSLFLDVFNNILWTTNNGNKYLIVTTPHYLFDNKRYGIIINPHPVNNIIPVELKFIFQNDSLIMSFEDNEYKVKELIVEPKETIFTMKWIDEAALTETEKVISLKGKLL